MRYVGGRRCLGWCGTVCGAIVVAIRWGVRVGGFFLVIVLGKVVILGRVIVEGVVIGVVKRVP